MPDQLTPDLIEDEVEEETFPCPQCGHEWNYEEDAEGCCQVECEACNGVVSSPDDLFYNENYGGALCESCDSDYTFSCPQCGNSDHRSEEEAYDCCRFPCHSCGETHDYEEDALDCCREPEDEDDGITPPRLDEVEAYPITVPAIAGRPVRLCSLEQEVVQGGRQIAGLLYEQGVMSSSTVCGYHWSGSRPGMIHVESDGSLPSSGGEVIYDRFNLSNPGDSETLSRIVTKIRQLRDDHGVVKTGFEAGIHVHIAAKDVLGNCLSTRDVAALYELWCYAEDMLYSLSASGWNRHRQPSDGYGGYCKAVPKFDGEATPAKVWRAMRSDRYYGLNFQRLFEASTSCSCGAGRMGDWPSCDCGAMDRATVEWRVFNASTLPRTIHAWLLMAHAITAYAMEHELGTLSENPYGSQSKTEKWGVLDWLLERLPLTEGEKDVILEVAGRSPGL